MTADLGTLLRVLNNNAVMVDTGGGRLILLGRGIGFGRQLGDRIELGVAHNLVDKSGAWFSYDSTRIGKGRENAKKFLLENPEMMAKIESAIRANSAGVSDALLTGPEEGDDI